MSAPLAIAGVLPDGVVNTSYSASLTATGGGAPYSWMGTGFPTGLTIDTHTGAVHGAPINAGVYSATVAVSDVHHLSATATSAIVVKPQTPTSISYSCSAPSGAQFFQYLGPINKIGNGYLVVGTTVVLTPTCAKVIWKGAPGFAVGQSVYSTGYTVSGVVNVATVIEVL